jgi:hypothetical protein
MDELPMVIISAGVGALVSSVGILTKNALDLRTKIDESLRENRIRVYKELWVKTRLLSLHPESPDVTYEKVRELSSCLREWYFEEGGMYLSHQARDSYYAVQKAIGSVIAHHETGKVSPRHYKLLSGKCSDFREELAKDLVSRRRGF